MKVLSLLNYCLEVPITMLEAISTCCLDTRVPLSLSTRLIELVALRNRDIGVVSFLSFCVTITAAQKDSDGGDDGRMDSLMESIERALVQFRGEYAVEDLLFPCIRREFDRTGSSKRNLLRLARFCASRQSHGDGDDLQWLGSVCWMTWLSHSRSCQHTRHECVRVFSSHPTIIAAMLDIVSFIQKGTGIITILIAAITNRIPQYR